MVNVGAERIGTDGCAIGSQYVLRHHSQTTVPTPEAILGKNFFGMPIR